MLSTTILLNIKSALQKNMTMMKHSKKNLNSLDNISLGFDENNERIFTVLLKELSELHPEMQKDSALMKLKRKIMLIHPKGTIAFLKEWWAYVNEFYETIEEAEFWKGFFTKTKEMQKKYKNNFFYVGMIDLFVDMKV